VECPWNTVLERSPLFEAFFVNARCLLQRIPSQILRKSAFDCSSRRHVFSSPNPLGIPSFLQLSIVSRRHRTLLLLLHNTPAVSQVNKGAVSSLGAAALLCHIQSDHQRLHGYHHTATYIPGVKNVAADDASRLQTLTPLNCISHSSLPVLSVAPTLAAALVGSMGPMD
jgi:hypothetical protein